MRITKLLPSAREQQSLLADLTEFLRQCSGTFAKLAALPRSLPAASPTETIRREIDQILATAAADWVPAQLANFLSRISERPAAERIRQSLDASASAWQQTLDGLLSELPNDFCETIILLRSIIEAFSRCDAAAPVWSETAKLARECLPHDQFQVELIRDSRQPSAWFEATEVEIPTARVTRVGLAIRVAGRDWACFPPGQLWVPKPIPRPAAHDAADVLAPIIAANPWLVRLVSPLPAIQKAGHADGTTAELLLQALDDFAVDAAEGFPSIYEISSEKRTTLDRVLDQFGHWAG